jgi:hypothetical protein
MTIALFIGLFMASGIICHILARRRNTNPVLWGVLGAALGLLAIPFVFLLKRS